MGLRARPARTLIIDLAYRWGRRLRRRWIRRLRLARRARCRGRARERLRARPVLLKLRAARVVLERAEQRRRQASLLKSLLPRVSAEPAGRVAALLFL